MEDLLANQEQTGRAMEQLLSSFKKTGRDRRTAEYVNRKIDTLEAYWKEFEDNHSRLCQYGDKQDAYFQDDHFKQALDFYNETKSLLLKSLPGPITPSKEKSTAGASAAEASLFLGNPLKRSQATDSKTDEMLKRQASNFKAFSRTVSDIDLEAITEKWEFEDTLKELQSRWSVIDTLHWQLDSELGSENEAYDSTFSTHEKTYKFMKKAINSKLWSNSHREKATPKMEIPSFHGNYYNWISFRDLFTETIHRNPLLSSAQKMQFLKSKVKGEAEKLIQHLQISSENYQVCWDILNHRYQNKRLIFTSHVNNMLNLPIIQQPNANQIKRLHDTTNECLNSIKNLGVDISNWDPLVVHILTQKLDSDTHSDYMESLNQPRELPTLKDFLDFLETKFTTMESTAVRKRPDNHSKAYNGPAGASTAQRQPQKSNQYKAFVTNKTSPDGVNPNKKQNRFLKSYKTCPICGEQHAIYHCQQFLTMPSDAKRTTISKLNLCKNCLFDHKNRTCFSIKKCRECNDQHNTILHEAFANDTVSPSSSIKPNQQLTQQSNTYVSQREDQHSEILITTAMVQVLAGDSKYQDMRALIDQCSQITLITEKAAQRLKLPRKKCRSYVAGVGEKENSCKGVITITCSSRYNPKFIFTVDAYIMTKLVKDLPSATIKKQHWPHLEGLPLADSNFNISRSVDMILGSDIYPELILDGLRKGTNTSMPVAQQTELGWIICGSTETSTSPARQCYVVNYLQEIQKFWEIEDIMEQSSTSSEEQSCIDYFKKTTVRREDGRYVVRLPFQPNFKQHLGSSKATAVAQFYQLEKRLAKNKHLELEYKQFIHEYLQLHHMKPSAKNTTPEYYLPHHAITRADSTTTKLRVVFNASARSSTGYSLNDVMCKGPNLQKDLQQIIITWRQFQFAYTADIEKMYRQIEVHEEDQAFQKIVWRDTSNQSLQDYQLSTVSYGTKPAPFLAMMCLKQLADDERQQFPIAAKALDECFYVDDYCGGDHSLERALQLRNDLVALLKSGGFNLRKWTASDAQLLTGLDKEQCNQNTFEFKQPETTKTLGLGWNPLTDTFFFKFTLSCAQKSYTKRSLLSDMSKLFDPLGWLTPLSTSMKVLFQTVWVSKLQWDDELPDEIKMKWSSLRQELSQLNTFEVKRWLGIEKNDKLELHGFCDASQKAYSGVIYCRIIREGISIISLVAAKARVSPMSKVVSIPRLELMGAELLAKLMNKVQQCLSQHHTKVYGWTDSTAVLGWLKGEITRFKPFISNRVTTIRKVINPSDWSYVKSTENPADCASRGLSVSQLKQHKLWWDGPGWLPHFTKPEIISYVTNLEIKNAVKQTNTITRDQNTSSVILKIVDQLLIKHSSFNKIVRILAWILRLPTYKQVHQPYLTLQELRRAKMLIIHSTQLEYFSEEIKLLQNNMTLSSKSILVSLNPILDDQGMLRVGGRLKRANINADMIHPLIIPHDSRLTTLLLQQAHELTFHGGARLTLSNLRQRYWVIGGNRATKKYIRRCVTCRKQNPVLQCQLMGDLPAARINPEKAFYHTGVDYTGYIDIKANKGRGIKTTKGYIAVFICMVTKAVHLEVVSDLTSTAFLAALSRMASRRGAPRHMYSDNGTNFVGANRLLQEQYEHLKNMFSNSFLTEISELGIEWHFNAPAWPSAGGLWEAAVRSLKYHLKRCLGEQKLTYEELTTLLSKIEMCLNSRPLCALTEDPEDLELLTPSHFLTARPGSTIIETATDARTRWHLTSKIFEDLWKRWRTEYLTQLSSRSKWRLPQENIRVGDMVTVQDEHLPAGKWLMGRVTELHQGHDRLVRVVSLKTKNGIIQRPIVKLSVLPVQPPNDSKSNQKCNEGSQPEPNTKVKGAKPGAFMSMAISLIFFMSLMIPAHGAHSITPFPNNMSLYFDSVSNMRIIRDKWTLVVYYDMSPYWEGNTAVSKALKHSEKICQLLTNNVQCTTILLQLQHEYRELQHYNRLLLNQHFDAHARQRRGLINGIGYVANSLFGVLDERFAEQYRKDIELIRQNEHHITNLLKNQTSVIEAEYNLLKRTESIISLQHKTINKHLNALEAAANSAAQKLLTISELQDFTLSAMTSSNLIQNLKGIQDTLLDTITDIYHGKFNAHLLSPDQLRNELQVISSQLTKDNTLPIENIQTDLRYIYSLLTIKARILKDYFIFEITFPLTTRETYSIHELIPIPHQIANNMITVRPINEYIAINLDKDAYVTLSRTELQSCLHNQNSYLCHINTPVYYLTADEKFCETNENNSQCTVSKTTCDQLWLELHDPSKYFYFCCNSYSVRIICRDRITIEQLTGAGIIGLDPHCMVKGKDFALYSRARSVNTITLKPEIVTPGIFDLNRMVNIPLKHYIEPRNDDINQTLNDLGEQINQLKSATELSYEHLSSHDIHQYTIAYTLLGVAVVAAAAFLWRRRRATASVECVQTAVVPSVVYSRELDTAGRQPSDTPVDSIRANNARDQATSPIPTKCVFLKGLP